MGGSLAVLKKLLKEVEALERKSETFIVYSLEEENELRSRFVGDDKTDLLILRIY